LLPALFNERQCVCPDPHAFGLWRCLPDDVLIRFTLVPFNGSRSLRASSRCVLPPSPLLRGISDDVGSQRSFDGTSTLLRPFDRDSGRSGLCVQVPERAHRQGAHCGRSEEGRRLRALHCCVVPDFDSQVCLIVGWFVRC
jgi:hypothetical protein